MRGRVHGCACVCERERERERIGRKNYENESNDRKAVRQKDKTEKFRIQLILPRAGIFSLSWVECDAQKAKYDVRHSLHWKKGLVCRIIKFNFFFEVPWYAFRTTAC